MLGCFATYQSGSCERTTLCNTAHNISDAFGNYLAGSDVVGHKERASTGNYDVIDHHTHQVLTDGVVNIECLRNSNFGADAVSRGRQVRLLEILENREIEETGKATYSAHNSGAVSCFDGVFHEFDRAVAGFDVHTCGGVSYWVGGFTHELSFSVVA